MIDPYYDYNNITLYNEDCIKQMQLLPSNSIDMILCDLPYGTTGCKWDTIIPFDLLWGNYKRIVKKDGAICLFGSEPFSSKLRISNIINFKYDWIWDKVRPSGFQIAKYVPMKRHEIISVFCYGSILWYPQKEKRNKPIKGKVYCTSESSPLAHNDGIVRTYTDKNPQSIIVFNKDSNSENKHPTKKPVSLCEYLIKTYTNEGETILDNCSGSGTTGVACINTNRKCILIENSKEYCEMSANRFIQAEMEKLDKEIHIK